MLFMGMMSWAYHQGAGVMMSLLHQLTNNVLSSQPYHVQYNKHTSAHCTYTHIVCTAKQYQNESILSLLKSGHGNKRMVA